MINHETNTNGGVMKKVILVWLVLLTVFSIYLYDYCTDVEQVVEKMKEIQVEVVLKEEVIVEEYPSYNDILPMFKQSIPKADRKARVGKQDVKGKIIVWTWKGGDPVDKQQFKQTIQVVLARLPHVKATEHTVALLMETAAVETRRGIWMTQMENGAARGIYQMNVSTIKDTLSWLKGYPDVKDAVMAFYEKDKSEDWNYKYNVPWQTAMAATYYWRHIGIDLHKLSESQMNRSMLYKLIWNTAKGATTYKKWVKEVKDYA